MVVISLLDNFKLNYFHQVPFFSIENNFDLILITEKILRFFQKI